MKIDGSYTRKRDGKAVIAPPSGRAADAGVDSWVLVYSFRNGELAIEVTDAYYDGSHAEFLWQNARGKPNAPKRWEGLNPDKRLAEAIARCVTKKSEKRYGDSVLLLIEVPPGVTTADDLTKRLASQPAQSDTPFVGIYVAGTFPKAADLDGEYRVITLKAMNSCLKPQRGSS